MMIPVRACLLLLLLSPAVQALEPFSAIYELSFNGVKKGETHFSLILHKDGYSFEAFTQPADQLVERDSKDEIMETSHGHFDNGRPEPDSYYYALRSASGTSMTEFFFDWKKMHLTLRSDDKQQKFILEDGTQDRLSYLLRAMVLLDSHQQEARFPRVSLEGSENIGLKKKLQKYISTRLGRMLAREISITSDRPGITRSLWLAAQHGGIPLLLTQKNDKGTVRMELVKIEAP
ncbi:DUF3108 domain-containing protein [Thiolapillus brandeum]|uniref:DUF3108 domain-containing protein n=1 Tax=Thiolapillus brandeum TaxID=1076588 RepID=A0A7U6GKD3_9GAMM|nr:DUF3108 domain-containing protein [Thiolapillus brandeum]BAO45199.1 hypothetical protein TBH_C2288 [Thiolapillus brandeum]